ncbi:hypothetical protein B0H63DRAFT_464309 [Podospora didyma]|uniref:Uncharacterized protein n=1 Tax=Podospora didyma TaxID=330526 RepID=A0AAE0NY00_9PEZI|nr:hypothetical protein B0H63DRAFT_464309 [Podospora didyma]
MASQPFPRVMPTLALLVAMHVTAVVAWPSMDRFESWYPQYRTTFETIMRQNCTGFLKAYRSGDYSNEIDYVGGGDEHSQNIQPLVQCLLENTSEYVKTSMSASQVLLGVTPTILSILGASVEESALLYIVGRRPFLAWILALGSPSLYFNRAFEYRNPHEIIQGHNEHLPQHRPGGWKSAGIVCLEYLLAMASVTNIAVQTWELGLQTFSSVWPETFLAPSVWAVLRVILHLLGMVLVRMRIRRNGGGIKSGQQISFWRWCQTVFPRCRDACTTEFRPCVTQDDVSVDTFKETKRFLCLAWLLHTLSVAHILYGTLIFSSLSFIGTRDATMVLGRFMASVLCCRVILMYEIAGCRQAYRRSNDDVVTVVQQVVSGKRVREMW